MADLSKLKNKSRLGTPPSMEESAHSLSAPEVAPIGKSSSLRKDGRTLRKTNRTIAFATRVTPEFDAELRDIAEEEGIKLVELLEKMLEAYKERK
ncbi:hypothetical protein D3C76_257140 [compost metagenome]